MMHSAQAPTAEAPSLHLREARHNHNRLQANIVSAAGGKTAPNHGARRAPQSRMTASHARSAALNYELKKHQDVIPVDLILDCHKDF